MRHIIIFIACAMLVSSCRAKKAAVSEKTDIVFVDTTKTIKDTATAAIFVTDSTKIESKTDAALTVVFVDSGGTISIKPDGTITMDGVKNVKGQAHNKTAIDTNVSATAESNQSHTDIDKGESTKQHHESVKPQKQTRKWYETALIWIGSLCCIAFLLWVIFLYLKRKS